LKHQLPQWSRKLIRHLKIMLFTDQECIYTDIAFFLVFFFKLIQRNILLIDLFHDEVYFIQHYVIKFVSDLRQVSGFLLVLRFPSLIYNWNIVESGVNWFNEIYCLLSLAYQIYFLFFCFFFCTKISYMKDPFVWDKIYACISWTVVSVSC
jgi:hypothetical protein